MCQNRIVGCDAPEPAEQTGQPFVDLAESATGFLNTVRGTNAEMDTMISLATRLRIVDPTARSRDVAIALREFASGEARSLAARFELPRTVVSGILDRKRVLAPARLP